MAIKGRNPNGYHDGHRRRIMKKYRVLGVEVLTERERLEILLYPMSSRTDTGYAADKLLSRFGSLKKVLNADCSSLVEVDGVGECLALQIRLIFMLKRCLDITLDCFPPPMYSNDDETTSTETTNTDSGENK